MNAWPALLALWATALATSPAQAVDGTARLCAAYAGKPAAASADPLPAGMVALPGGRFKMGSDRFYREERPLRDAEVGPFAILRHEVTNAQFAAFVAATGYKTVAERPLDAKQFPTLPRDKLLPGSLVFRQPDRVRDMVDLSQWWAWTPGAHWRAPEGQGSSIRGRENHPVVHIAFEDAMAYSFWRHAAQ